MKSGIRDVDIVIVGGGITGLAAALECKKHQKSFVVLEARDRPGGRLYSVTTKEGIRIDLGGQWVGVNHYRIKRLIEEFGIKTYKIDQKGNSIYEWNGKIKKTKRLPPLSPVGLFDLIKVGMRIKTFVNQLPEGIPFSSPIARKLDKETVEQFIQATMFSQEGKAFYKLIVEEITCSNAHEVSLLDLVWCIKSTGTINYLLQAEQEWMSEGAQTLTIRMADSLGDTVVYNTPVERISYQHECTYVYSSNDFWRAKKVIVAIPPNLTTRIVFAPPLPGIRQQLSQRSGMPSVIKMIMIYHSPFWKSQGLNGKLFSSSGPVTLTLDSSPPDSSKGVLSVFLTGKHARELENMDRDERVNKVLQVLGKYFGKEAYEPEEVYEKNWAEDEWTQGGYATHYAPGVLTHFGSSLFKPISSIHWAGTEEAIEWRTYMEGAVQSGQDVAKLVISQLI
ncbi:flavin monoamine oxidase family protein [Bacillus salitolerans]|uniref:Flavin monoamine oxidase family protein n=1 Tax=Bacillus salitolerans TaxID=1437434 RepID=A0ABW4LRP8_9BACI